MPTMHRGTGCGMTLAFGRLASVASPLVATFGNNATSVPIWVCCALYVVIGIVAATLPYRPNDLSRKGATTIEELQIKKDEGL